MMPNRLLKQEEGEWQDRQLEMEAWYEELFASPSEATSCFVHDYAPYTSILSKLSGSILDIGGGNGIARRFLPKAKKYVSIDPSLEWLRSEWQVIADRFSDLEQECHFVRGLGEYLPFPAHSFDHALSFWSLNHTIQPERVFQQVYTVLRPSGRFLVVLEDMEPRWRDIHSLLSQIYRKSRKKALIVSKLRTTLRMSNWPLQKDHIRICEADIMAWSSSCFAITLRQWIGQCLAYELRRL